ncbi:DNA/RNA non-specific endonuclease [Saccharopolyspora rhizosphaerae]|uniref:DNA/RNA non-specific endonuclease n=1 Tax=Saccharopolyspora rhizosphaerae TaxID=2492662 RepID=A0A426JV05_9PSEU|nr:DNA/RNA non-specific endonuclease [Saccharopolyspora rhizosphaerae]RRO17000.1 DNA/RNA non-specific endonuclease [Saccharopolyspora rhizosphaerae]
MHSSPIELSIPLTITVEVEESDGTAPRAHVARPFPELVRPRPYYDGCTGYDPAFLGPEVALPELSDEQRRNAAKNSAAPAGEDPTVLPYTHFSVVVNRRRQLAYYTVVNIDGAESARVGRRRDAWYLDPRIAESEQIGESLYLRNALDRGHLVRRLDPVWGAEAARANDDTFHFTNCSPQHEKFNQGKDLWLGLEDFILEHAELEDRKVTVFTGPVMSEDDPLYKGVRLPLAFWKLIAYCKTGAGLSVSGYVLEQARLIEDVLGFEALFDAGTYRVPLAHLRDRTGLDFGHLEPFETALASDGLFARDDHVPVNDDCSNLVL